MHKNISENRLKVQREGFSLFRISAIVVVLVLFLLLYFIILRGIPVLSWEFLTQSPKKGMTEGGIFPAIVGTFLLGLGAMLFSLPIGVLTAIYLTEFAKKGKFTSAVRVGINTLAGMPSIVFGLFGFAFFCKILDFGVSVLSGALTLAIMSLPIIISTSEEALKAVPDAFREASLSLGATRWRTTYKIIFPNAVGGIITGSILAMGRAVGETAPIIFTAATFYTRRLPKSPFDEVMALPFHIYGLVTEGINPAKQLPIAFGSAIILLLLVLSLSSVGIYWRHKVRKRRLW